MDEKEREALRSTERAVAEVLDDLGFMSWDRCVTAASAVLAVLPSRETDCGCGCRTGEDADRNECGCDCHDPDSANYRDLPADDVEAYSDDENERGALRQFMDEGATFQQAVAMLNGFLSRETVAPTEEEIAKALHPEAWGSNGNEAAREWARKDNRIAPLLALFPGEGREAVEAAQRERDAQIAEDMATPGSKYVAAAIREAGR